MFDIIFRNPEIKRNLRSRLRLKTVIITAVIIVAIFLFIGTLALGPSIEAGKTLKIKEQWHTLFMFYASIALLIGYAYGAVSTATNIVAEKEKKTYDFLFLTPLSNTTLAIGKLFGSTALAWLILLITIPFIIVAGIVGQINVVHLVLYCLVLITGTLFFASLGLLISVSVNRAANATAGALVLVFCIAFIIGMFNRGRGEPQDFLSILSPISMMREIGKEAVWYSGNHLFMNNISFFGGEINGAILTILAYLYLTFWAVVAIARKIRNPVGIYLSKLQAIIFFIIFEIFMVGAVWEFSLLPSYHLHYEDVFRESLSIFSFINIILLLVFSLGLTLSYDDYFAYVRAKVDKRPYGLFHQRTPAHLLFLIFFITISLGFVIALRPSESVPEYIILILHLVVALETIALFYLTTQLLRILMKTYGVVVSVLLTLIASLIPPLVIEVFNLPAEYHFYFNPVAYLTLLYEGESILIIHSIYYTLPILLGILLVIISIFFICRHYQIKKQIKLLQER